MRALRGRLAGYQANLGEFETAQQIQYLDHFLVLHDGVAAVGSGSGYALAAARALLAHTALSAAEVAERSLRIAAEICIYTNDRVTVVSLP